MIGFLRRSIPALLLSVAAHAEPPVLARTAEIWRNPDCAAEGTCSLKEFELRSEIVGASDPKDYRHDVRTWARFETADMKSLNDYGIVQFIRGCVFTSVVENGKIEKIANYLRGDGRFRRPLHHATWEIDTDDVDPLYASLPDEKQDTRLDFYYWAPKGKWFNTERKLFRDQKSKANWPSLYVTDRPGGARRAAGAPFVTNTSLEFRTCIYRLRDIPLAAKLSDVNFARPLHCFEWRSSAVYDHEKSEWTHPDEVDAFCLAARS